MEEIIELIKTGQNERLEQKLQEEPSLVKARTEQGISLLQFAAYCRNRLAIDLIKKHKQNLDIFEAASIGDLETIEPLLDKNPGMLNGFSPDGFTILGLTSFFGHVHLVLLLLDRGADPNIPSNNSYKVTPIHSACAISNMDIAQLLIKHGANVNLKQMQGITPLHSASHNGKTTLVELLIHNGAHINAKMENGKTPLNMAQEKDHIDTVEFIKSHGGE